MRNARTRSEMLRKFLPDRFASTRQRHHQILLVPAAHQDLGPVAESKKTRRKSRRVVSLEQKEKGV
jgi:hypothetical protein